MGAPSLAAFVFPTSRQIAYLSAVPNNINSDSDGMKYFRPIVVCNRTTHTLIGCKGGWREVHRCLDIGLAAILRVLFSINVIRSYC